MLTMEGGPAAYHVLAKPTGPICNLDCEYCFFLSKEMLYPGDRSAEGYHYYFRQLWDMKGSLETATMSKTDMKNYAYACRWTLARAHAPSGDRIAIGSYLGKSETFDQAMAEFGVRYADQAESDYAKFMEAANGGRIELDTSVNK